MSVAKIDGDLWSCHKNGCNSGNRCNPGKHRLGKVFVVRALQKSMSTIRGNVYVGDVLFPAELIGKKVVFSWRETK